MKSSLPSLLTPNAEAGLALAAQMAERLHQALAEARDKVEKPGGMSYLAPQPVPLETTGSILFYAIAAANQGWSIKS